MSHNPFTADAAVAARIKAVPEDTRAALRAEALALAPRSPAALAANMGGILTAADAAALVAKYGLADIKDLMRLLVDAAREIARPSISNFYVGAVGLEAETGNLILGGNVEFPRAHMGLAIHGEGFLANRAWSRGTTISTIAIFEAHPCAHCRQFLSEFHANRQLVLIDPIGHELPLSVLYPWPFDPGYLGEEGAKPGQNNWPDLTAENAPESLLAAGRRSHSPYSGSPSAVILTMHDGQEIRGTAIESVAFNPTMQPMMAALVDVIAHGYSYQDIVSATLGTTVNGHVDYAASTKELLASVAPAAGVKVVNWR